MLTILLRNLRSLPLSTHSYFNSAGVLTINGYSPSCSAREIVNTILSKVLLGRRCTATNLVERAQFVAAQFSGSASMFGGHGLDSSSTSSNTSSINSTTSSSSSSSSSSTSDYHHDDVSSGGGHGNNDGGRRSSSRPRPPNRLYILLHNIDGPSLRSDESQEALSYLASSNRIHLVATTDHLNTMFLWHQRLMHRFNWLWNNTTTYEHYDAETEYETLSASGSNAMQAQGTKNVLHSLTPNHRGILKLLAEYLYNERNGKSSGMDFYEFLTRCQADMLAHNDQVLRNHLTELLDHALVAKRKNKNGETLYYIPLAEEVIRKVILQEGSGAESP